MITAKALLVALMTSGTPGLDYRHLDVDEAFCLVKNVWFESRAENIEGQIKVAQTTMERVRDPRWPNTICGVVLAGHPDPEIPTMPAKFKCSFSWNCDGKDDKIKLYYRNGEVNYFASRAYSTVMAISLMVMNEEIAEFCAGANHYYNPSLASPYWAEYYTEQCRVGDHIFLRREKGSKL